MSESTAASVLPARVEALVRSVLTQNPMHTGFLTRALSLLQPGELDALEGWLAFTEVRGLAPDYIAESYLTVVADTLREQIHFARTGTYRHTRYAEVAADVYHDPEYMGRYMHGLAVTRYLWPNHLAMTRHFEAALPRRSGGAYLEIGPGHGGYTAMALRAGDYAEVTAVDISATSIAQTRAALEYFCPEHAGRCTLRELDFLVAEDLPERGFDAIVMGEVLEHVEQPAAFLRRIAALARPGAFIYVTTCVNAPAIDHIHLFRSPAEVEALLAEHGLEVVSALRLPYEGKTLDECEAGRLAVNVAYVLRPGNAR